MRRACGSLLGARDSPLSRYVAAEAREGDDVFRRFRPLLGLESQLAAALMEQEPRLFAPEDAGGKTPRDVSLEFAETGGSGDEALQHALQQNASRLASEPQLRQSLRELAVSSGAITSKVTARGRDAVAPDPLHAMYPVSGLRNKPARVYLDAAEDTSAVDVERPEEEAVLLKAAEAEVRGSGARRD
jgi:hypothetical protein